MQKKRLLLLLLWKGKLSIKLYQILCENGAISVTLTFTANSMLFLNFDFVQLKKGFLREMENFSYVNERKVQMIMEKV